VVGPCSGDRCFLSHPLIADISVANASSMLMYLPGVARFGLVECNLSKR